jgi:hypothetical protein
MNNFDDGLFRVGRKAKSISDSVSTLLKHALEAERNQKSMIKRAFGRDIGAEAKEALKRHAKDLERLQSLQSSTRNMPSEEVTWVAPYVSAISDLAKAFDDLTTLPIAQQTNAFDEVVSAEAQQRMLRQRQRDFERIVGPLGATTQLRGILARVPKAGVVADFARGFDRLANSFAEVVAEPFFTAKGPTWLLAAPALFTYTGNRALGAIVGVDIALIDAASDEATESELGEVRDQLVERLGKVNVGLADIYRGAIAAMERRDPDWVRHVSTSLRELLINLIDSLAPELMMDAWKDRTKEDTAAEGGWSRKAKLRYIFRAGREAGTERMVDNIIDGIVMLIYPASGGVHALIPPHNEAGLSYMLSHAQGAFATILTAAGR